MPKTKKYSLDYWVKKVMGGWTPEKDILAAVKTYVQDGSHPEIEFSGTALAFATALYLSRFKKGTPWSGFFPTPEVAAAWAADLLPMNRGAVVLDPGCGFGSLSAAVEKRGGVPLMVEVSSAVTPIAQAIWGEERVTYRDFLDGYRPTEFDAVIANPPFGNVFGHSDAAGEFMGRIADLARGGTYVSAILPRGYLEVERPKRRVEIAQRFTIIERHDLAEDTFAPLTKIATTLYLLNVKRDGALVGEVLPRAAKSIAVPGQRIEAVQAAAEDVDYADMTEEQLAEVKGTFTVEGAPDETYDNLLDAINACEDAAVAQSTVLHVLSDRFPIWECDGRHVGDEDQTEDDDDIEDDEPADDEDVLPPATWHDPRELHLTVEGEEVRVEYSGRESTLFKLGGLDFHLHGPSISPTGFRAHLTYYREVASHGTPEAAARHIVTELQATQRAFVEKNRKSWPLDLPAKIQVSVDGLAQAAQPISWNGSNQRWEVWLIDQGHGLTLKPDQILTPAKPPKRTKSKDGARTGAGWTPPQPVSVPGGWQQPIQFEFTLGGQSIRVEYHASRSIGFQTGQLQFGFFGKVVSSSGFYNIFAQYADVAHCGNPEMAAIELAKQQWPKLVTATPAAAPVENPAVANRPAAGFQWPEPKYYPALNGEQTVVVVARSVADIDAEVQQGTVLLNSVGFDSQAEAVSWLDHNARRPDDQADLAQRISAVSQRTLKADRAQSTSLYQSWHDDTLMLMRPNRQAGTPWVACVSTLEGEWSAVQADGLHPVQGVTLFAALAALRDWLRAMHLDVTVRLAPLNPGWTAATIGELIEVVNTHSIVLVADDDLGIPTIHGLPHAEHKGYGLFTTTCAEYAGSYDAGGSMHRLSTSLGWTELRLDRGTFPYDKAAVLDQLQCWQAELTPVVTQTVICSNCFVTKDLTGSGTGPIIQAHWKIDAPYVFCPECQKKGVHSPTRTAETNLAVTDLLPAPADLPTDYARAEWQRTLVAFESSRDKEPWQMTRDEFMARHRPMSGGAGHHTLLQLIVNREYDVVNTLTDNEQVSAGILTAAVDYLDRLRGVIVQAALTEGKPVPEEIQREFPDEAEAARKRHEKVSAKAEAKATAAPAIGRVDDLADDELDGDELDDCCFDGCEFDGDECDLEAADDQDTVAAANVESNGDWSQPVDFAIEVEGELVHVHFEGYNSVGYSHGSLHFEFFGPNISSSGYRSYFTYLKAVSQYGRPQAAARIIAAELAKELADEVKKARKKWPRKPNGDMAVRVGGEVIRAHLISWNDFNAWWYVWLRRDNESAMIKDDDVIEDWMSYFAAHLNPGDHVVFRSVSTILHGNIVRVVPGSAHSVEVQLPDGTQQFVSPADLIGLWDELSPAERGEKFEIPTFGLANTNPFDMPRADFDEWVLAVDPLHGVEWSAAYRYFAEGLALSVVGWEFFKTNAHFSAKRQAIDPQLTGNPFAAPRDQFIHWVQAHVDGTEAQAAYLQGYAAVSGGSDHILLPEARDYLVTQPLYGAAWTACQAAASTAAPVSAETAEPTVAVLAVFSSVSQMENWVRANGSQIVCIVPDVEHRPQVDLTIRLPFFKTIVRRGAVVEFKDLAGVPQSGVFEKWQRDGSLLVRRYTAATPTAEFGVRPEQVVKVVLEFKTDPKPKIQPVVAKPAPAAKPAKPIEPKIKRPSGLPADIPDVIEVDVGGRKPVWVLATIIKVAGPQLTCKRRDDDSTLKTPLYGRDIAWRVPAAGEVA